MVKSYLGFELSDTTGVITSPNCNVLYVDEKTCVTGALQALVVWNLKTGQLLQRFQEENALETITCLAQSPANELVIAAGYSNGAVRVWDLIGKRCLMTLTSHTKAINRLTFDKSGATLASASDDTDVVVWDVASETGLFKLNAHKAPVTDVVLLNKSNHLISCSKDTFIKIWDLDTQHCVQTLIGHRNEVWSIAVDSEENRLYAGSSDTLLRVWDIEPLHNSAAVRREVAPDVDSALAAPSDTHDDAGTLALIGAAEQAQREAGEAGGVDVVYYGAVQRRGDGGRVSLLRFARQDATVLYCVPAGSKKFELYTLFDEKTVTKRRRRRRQRARQRHATDADAAADEPETGEQAQTVASDECGALAVLNTSHKIASAAVDGRRADKTLRVMVSLKQNAVQTFAVTGQSGVERDDKDRAPIGLAPQFRLELTGHRADVRGVALSSDDRLLLSCAKDGAKVWHVHGRGECLRTLPRQSVLCGVFVPGDRHVLLGCQDGTIVLFELASQECIQTIQAHDGPVWALSLRPGAAGFATGGGDKTVKFWEFEVEQSQVEDTDYVESDDSDDDDDDSNRSSSSDDDDVDDKKRKKRSKKQKKKKKKKSKRSRRMKTVTKLGIVANGSLELADDVLALTYSADATLLCAALLDHTVQVYRSDGGEHQFFLSLYGHRLPVLCCDASSDGLLLITGSSDKNVKVWGLDFGDCHRSMFAHADAVMCVRTQPRTHYFFSGGKDGQIKYWDADSGELVLVLRAHVGPVWSLAASSRRTTDAVDVPVFVVSGGADRSLRVWNRTEEPVFVDEQAELRLEEQLDADELARAAHAGGVGVGDDEAGGAVQRTAESLKDTERLADAVQLADSEVAARAAARRAGVDDHQSITTSKKQKNSAPNDDDDGDDDSGATRVVSIDVPQAEHADADLLDDEAADWARLHLPKSGANPLLLGLTPSSYVLRAVRNVAASRMDAVLLALPFNVSVSLLRYARCWLEAGIATELAARLAVFVVRVNFSTLTHSARLRPLIDSLALHGAAQVRALQDELGFNEAALTFMRRQLELQHVNVFDGTNTKLRELRRNAKSARAKTIL